MNQFKFKAEELISKNGKTYPVVGGRLRIAHESNEELSITTELVSYSHQEHATVRATVTFEKGVFSAYGAATAKKDPRLISSLIELAETRSISRCLRFAGYGVEYTSMEEIGEEATPITSPARIQSIPASVKEAKPIPSTIPEYVPATRAQLHCIETIATVNKWSAIECCRRILQDTGLESLDELSKDSASTVISRLKEAA